MKIKPRLLLLPLLIVGCLNATPLSKTTAVHTKPDEAAPTLTVLSAGTEPTPATGVAAALPPGWSAVELSGPHEAYVLNKDLSKSLDVRVGAAIHAGPKADSAILSVMEKGDSAEISGRVQGKWTQIRLQKKITGYINVAPAAAAPVATSPTPSTSKTTPQATTSANTTMPPPPPSPAPVAPAAYAGNGRAVPVAGPGDAGSAALPRLFPGKFVSTRRLLTPRRPYDYQLNDSGGERYAYLDLSRLLQTEQLDKYIDHTVLIYGTAKAVPNSKDIVIDVESLQLR
jgi:hypothetical protein